MRTPSEKVIRSLGNIKLPGTDAFNVSSKQPLPRGEIADKDTSGLLKLWYSLKTKEAYSSYRSHQFNLSTIAKPNANIDYTKYPLHLIDKVFDISPIAERIKPFIEAGFEIYNYTSFRGINDVEESIDVTVNDEADVETLLEFMSLSIRSNLTGRLCCLAYNNPYYHRCGIAWANGYQYFAFNPLDKNNPDLSDIWVEVYR